MHQNSDFIAFKSKVAQRSYEKREEPTIDDVAKAIDQIATGFEEFKSDQESRLGKVETKLARPGAVITGPSGEERSFFIDRKTGERLPVLKKSDSLADALQLTSRDGFSLGDFVRANVLGSTKASSGPALVADRLSGMIIDDVRRKTALLNAGAITIPISGPTIMARIASDPTVYKHTEGSDDVTTSDMKLTAVTLDPKLLVALVPLTEELVMDSTNLDNALQVSVAAAFAQKLDALGLATVLADTAIPSSSAAQDPAVWADCLSAVGEGLAADQSLPDAMVCNTADFMARSSQLASTAGSWLGKPPVLAGMSEYPTTGVSAGTAIYGGFSSSLALAVRSQLRFEVVRWTAANKGSHTLVAHMRADFFVIQPAGLFIQKETP